MKELSVEQKAKAYDEAIERAKALYDNNQPISGNNVIINNIFPELKESEGEKIRNGLIGYFRAGKCENISSYHGISTNDILAWLEKQGEQKSEPKFKEGDWLVHNERRNIIKVVKSNPLAYKVVDTLGYHHTITDTAIESNYHLWSIKYAKDGDVLASEDKVFLYSGKLDLSDRVCAYCGIYKAYDKLHFTKCAIGNYFTYKKPYPATKEQRELLFQKMKEAEYEWDADKKELRKIEHKTVEWLREDEQNLNACLGYIPDEFLRRWLTDSIHIKYDKAAWSEEDERNLDWLITVCERIHRKSDPQVAPKSALILRDWLKSIKPQEYVGYNPYKTTVESIAKMCDKYENVMWDETEAKDFLCKVSAKCREAAVRSNGTYNQFC